LESDFALVCLTFVLERGVLRSRFIERDGDSLLF